LFGKGREAVGRELKGEGERGWICLKSFIYIYEIE
jgi:hypothetical protein